MTQTANLRYALFLNGNLQFNSFDEYRYHEALVHPAFAAFNGDAKRVLVLGGVAVAGLASGIGLLAVGGSKRSTGEDLNKAITQDKKSCVSGAANFAPIAIPSP